jgi:hypothetical protein
MLDMFDGAGPRVFRRMAEIQPPRLDRVSVPATESAR